MAKPLSVVVELYLLCALFLGVHAVRHAMAKEDYPRSCSSAPGHTVSPTALGMVPLPVRPGGQTLGMGK